MLLQAALSVAVLLPAVTSLAPPPRLDDDAIPTESRLLVTVDEDHSLYGYPHFGPRGKRVVYVIEGRKGLRPYVDGKAGKWSTFLDFVTFSPDGARVAWRAGKRVSAKQEKWAVFVDRKGLGWYDWVDMPAFLADGKSVVYRCADGVGIRGDGAYTGGTFYLRHNRKALGPRVAGYGMSVDKIVVSPNGRDFAYPVNTPRGWSIVRQDKMEAARYSMVGAPVFSPDSRKLVYAGFDGTSWQVVGGPKVDRVKVIGDLSFRPDGRLAYPVNTDDDRWQATIEGKPISQVYPFIRGPIEFSAKGRHWAFIANEGGQTPGGFHPPGFVKHVTGGRWFFVVDDERQPDFDEVRDLVFHPKPKGHRAKAALVAYAARIGDRWQVVSGDHRSELYDWVGAPVFIDANTIGFGAQKGRELWWRTLSTKTVSKSK